MVQAAELSEVIREAYIYNRPFVILDNHLW